MTLARLRETRVRAEVERRNLAGINPGGYASMDPSAIPPHGFNHMQRAGVLVTPHTLLQVDVVFTALRIISNNIIKMGDLRAYTESLSDDNIPYRMFLAEQPPILTDTFGGRVMQCTGRDRTVWSMALFGEAFWYVLVRDRLAYPSALEVLHPAFMDVKQDTAGNPVYVYGTGQNKTELDPENVIHIPLKSLPGARRALSPTEYAGVAGALAIAAYEFGSTWFSQGASPSFLLSTDQKLGQDEVQRIAEKFLIEHSGLSQAHLPLVLDSGLKAEKMMTSPDEAQYLQTLEYARSVIASWFGIPQSKMGNALQRQTPSPPHGRQEESISFQQDTLSGYTIPLEEAHGLLLPAGTKASFDESMLSKPDAQFLALEIQALRMTQAASINDVRVRKLGWAPVPGGDDVLAPLASNTAPSQTEDNPEDGGDSSGGAATPTPVQPRGSGGGGATTPTVGGLTINVQPASAPDAHFHAGDVHVENRVEPTPINVEAPNVYTEPTTVHVENRVEPTPISVAPPVVTVENNVAPSTAEIRVEPSTANVEVEAPIVTVQVPPTPKRRTKVLRDQRGRISGTEED